jgi:hypothetical protein
MAIIMSRNRTKSANEKHKRETEAAASTNQHGKHGTRSQNNPNGTNDDDDKTSEPKKCGFALSRFCKLSSIDKFTFVIAVFTALLFIATAVNIWAFIESERSEITVSDIRLNSQLTAETFATLIIEIVNPSKSSAFVDEFRLYIDGGMTVPNEAKPRIMPNMHPTIHPGVPIHNETDIPQKFPADYVNGVNKGEYHIWVIGSLRWHDHFGWFGGGETGFCFYYDPSRGRGVDSFYRCHDPRYEY